MLNKIPKKEEFLELIYFIKNLFNNKEIISLHEPNFIGNEKKYLQNCIDDNFVSSVGKYVNEVEDLLKSITRNKYAIATCNGTSALHTCLLSIGVCKEDEVISQPLTFVATCNAIKYCGAKPIFVDVDKETMGMSPSSLNNFLENNVFIRGKKCINKHSGKVIRACIATHTLGHPCKISVIKEICEEYNIILIEDAAESLGSTYIKKHTGTFGSLGIYSFNGNKTITSGGGGCIVTDNYDLANRAMHLTTTAKIKHHWHYDHDEVGYNYRMPNLNAALLLAQLENLEKFIFKKRNLAKIYQSYLSKFKYCSFFSEPKRSKSNYWLQSILTNNSNDRDLFLEIAHSNSVMARPLWRPMNQLKFLKTNTKSNLDNAIDLFNRVVCLPSSVTYNDFK